MAFVKPSTEQLNTILGLLERAPSSSNPSDLVLFLKKHDLAIDPEVVSIAIDTFRLRGEAVQKLGSWASQGFFSSTLLPQASRLAFATYRASFFKGCDHVLEIGTGTGSDTAALACVAKHVTTIELDPVRAALAKQNLDLQGIENVTMLVGSLRELKESITFSDFDGLYADPARRLPNGTRIKDPALYSPSLDDLLALPIEGISAIKISPGLFLQSSPEGWVRQFLGFEQECLEQTLWKNVPITDSSIKLVDTGEDWAPSITTNVAHPYPHVVGSYFYEAHGVVNRSLHLDNFFGELGIQRVAPHVAYGTSDTIIPSSRLVTCYSVLYSFPFSRKKLSKTLHQLQWSSRTEFKKRSFAGDIESIRSAMNLPGHSNDAPFGTIFFFTWDKKNWVVLGTRNEK